MKTIAMCDGGQPHYRYRTLFYQMTLHTDQRTNYD
jgi:hypothetical protein